MWSGFGFLPCDRVTWEARQTLTTLEATRPDRGRRSCERGAPSGAGRTRSPGDMRCSGQSRTPLRGSLHSALRAILDCPAQLRWLAMNVAPEGDLRVKTSALKLGRLVRDLQSLFPVRRSCSGPQSRSHPDHIDAGRPTNRPERADTTLPTAVTTGPMLLLAT